MGVCTTCDDTRIEVVTVIKIQAVVFWVILPHHHIVSQPRLWLELMWYETCVKKVLCLSTLTIGWVAGIYEGVGVSVYLLDGDQIIAVSISSLLQFCKNYRWLFLVVGTDVLKIKKLILNKSTLIWSSISSRWLMHPILAWMLQLVQDTRRQIILV